MELKALSRYKRVVIQCHDVPDADSICSGFALQSYLRSGGAEAELVYGGREVITKPSLLMLMDMLRIDIAHVDALPPDIELLITVDCQRGAGNVQTLELPVGARFVIIDHHRAEVEEGEHTVIRPYLGSCATLVWDLLRKEDYALDTRVRNALFYGLYTDTNGLAELRHPLDRDMAELSYDVGMIRRLKNSTITVEELDIIGRTLTTREMMGSIGLLRAEPCDANLLGLTSDIAQQVVQMDCCVVYCAQKHGLKISIRSSAREIMASEIASFLCRGVGSGGGSIEKAGGFLSFAKIAEAPGGLAPEEFLSARVNAYLDNYDLIYAGTTEIDFSAMPCYSKRPTPVGFALSTDIFPNGTKITIRTLEGDVDTVTGESIYLMIGIQGEVYPILRERFETDYRVTGERCHGEAEYAPAIINRITGERREIMPHALACVPANSKVVRASALKKDTKVFTFWDTEKYFYGSRGDFLVANEGGYDDCYIVRKSIFETSYEPI